MNVKELIKVLKKYPDTHTVKTIEFCKELSCVYSDTVAHVDECHTGCEKHGNKEYGVMLRAKPWEERQAELTSDATAEAHA